MTPWLIAMVGPLVARVLLTMGLSIAVTTGLVVSVAALKTTFLSYVSGMPAAAVQLLGLFGAWEAFGMMFGALTFAVAWHSTAGAWKLARTA